jgi:hypothetical protein
MVGIEGKARERTRKTPAGSDASTIGDRFFTYSKISILFGPDVPLSPHASATFSCSPDNVP